MFRIFAYYSHKDEQLMKAKTALPHYKELQNVRREIELFPLHKYSLDDISSSLNLNNNYFNRIYKQLYGTTFNQDQINSRIRFAKHLLLNTDLSVADAAEKCDYTDSKYFIRQFSSVTGLSPKQYRTAMEYFCE